MLLFTVGLGERTAVAIGSMIAISSTACVWLVAHRLRGGKNAAREKHVPIRRRILNWMS